MFVRKHGARGLIRRQEPRPLPAGLLFLMRLSETATVVDTDLQLSAGNRRQSRSMEVLRGCEGPRSVAKVASDPGAPSHFSAPAGNGRGFFLRPQRAWIGMQNPRAL